MDFALSDVSNQSETHSNFTSLLTGSNSEIRFTHGSDFCCVFPLFKVGYCEETPYWLGSQATAAGRAYTVLEGDWSLNGRWKRDLILPLYTLHWALLFVFI